MSRLKIAWRSIPAFLLVQVFGVALSYGDSFTPPPLPYESATIEVPGKSSVDVVVVKIPRPSEEIFGQFKNSYGRDANTLEVAASWARQEFERAYSELGGKVRFEVLVIEPTHEDHPKLIVSQNSLRMLREYLKSTHSITTEDKQTLFRPKPGNIFGSHLMSDRPGFLPAGVGQSEEWVEIRKFLLASGFNETDISVAQIPSGGRSREMVLTLLRTASLGGAVTYTMVVSTGISFKEAAWVGGAAGVVSGWFQWNVDRVNRWMTKEGIIEPLFNNKVSVPASRTERGVKLFMIPFLYFSIVESAKGFTSLKPNPIGLLFSGQYGPLARELFWVPTQLSFYSLLSEMPSMLAFASSYDFLLDRFPHRAGDYDKWAEYSTISLSIVTISSLMMKGYGIPIADGILLTLAAGSWSTLGALEISKKVDVQTLERILNLPRNGLNRFRSELRPPIIIESPTQSKWMKLRKNLGREPTCLQLLEGLSGP